VSDALSLIYIYNNSTADQASLTALGVSLLAAFGPLGSLGFALLTDLYSFDTTNHMPKFTIATVFNDGGNNGTWYKTGNGNGSGNWTQGSTATLVGLSTALTTETTNRTAADTVLTNNLATEVTNRTNADTAIAATVTTEASTRAAADTALTIAPHTAANGDVLVANISNLPTNTYSNGAAGVGSTITSNVNGAFPTVDGVAPVLNMRFFYKVANVAARMGIYILNVLGDAGTPWQLTRDTDCDTPSKISGIYFNVTSGTINGGKQFFCPLPTPAISIGSTAIILTRRD
jgi:hypothetical protein